MSKKKDTESADPTEPDGGAPEGAADGTSEGTSSGSAGESGSGSGAKSAGSRQRRSRRKTAAAGGRSGESRSAKRAGADDEAPAAAKDAKDTETGRGEAAENTSAEESSAEGSARAGSSTGDTGETGEKAAEASTPRRAGTAETPDEGGAETPGETPDAGAPDEAAAGPDTGPEAGKGFDATRADELAYHDATMEELAGEAAEERGYRTVWATLFFILLGAIAVAGLTLWGAPKVAPHLPAAVAEYLMPGQVETAGRLAALEDRLAGRAEATDTALAEIRGRLDSLAAEVEAAAAAEDTQAAIADLRQTAEGAAQDTRALAGRVDTVQSQLAAAREELAAVSETLTGGGEGTAPPELAAALAALRSRVDRLAATLEEGPSTAGLAERLDTLSSRVAELEGSIAEAREAGSEASGAIRQARLQSALDTLASRLAAGQPYDTPLGEAAELGEVAPPEALAAGAGSGLATAAELEASFGRHAQEAIAADIRARSGDGAVGQAFGWLRAQVAGRPVSEQEGDSVAAVTSRIAARLEEGRLAEALAEAEALPEPARAGLGRWLEQLRARVAAERALTEWRDQITARG